MENSDAVMAGNVILQTVSQAYAHRLALYASSTSLSAFPATDVFCDAAEELGKEESKYNGPSLVLLRNCRIPARELIAHILATFLRGYVMRIYWCHYVAASKFEMLSFIRLLIEELREASSNAICQQICSKGDPYSGQELACASDCSAESKLKSLCKFRIQTYPRELETILILELPEIEFSLHDYTHSIYVVESKGIFYYGLDVGSNMYLPGCNREALSKGCVSKASTKIEEALNVANFKLHKDMTVLDVGAAPGAWTQYLSENVKTVLAIDPGSLSDKAKRYNVSHLCKKVEEAHGELKSWTNQRYFDFLVCDINKHPFEAANIVLPLLQYLKSGSGLILTLKFYGRGKSKELKINKFFEFFHGKLKDMKCIWLLANSIYERTFVGIKI